MTEFVAERASVHSGRLCSPQSRRDMLYAVAPSGEFLVYTGADVGTNFFVKAVNADRVPRQFPNLILTRGARRLAFLGEDTLVILKGDVSHKEFWRVDLRTGRERQLTNLGRAFAIGDFDVSPDVVKSSSIGRAKSRISFCST